MNESHFIYVVDIDTYYFEMSVVVANKNLESSIFLYVIRVFVVVMF